MSPGKQWNKWFCTLTVSSVNINAEILLSFEPTLTNFVIIFSYLVKEDNLKEDKVKRDLLQKSKSWTLFLYVLLNRNLCLIDRMGHLWSETDVCHHPFRWGGHRGLYSQRHCSKMGKKKKTQLTHTHKEDSYTKQINKQTNKKHRYCKFNSEKGPRGELELTFRDVYV